MAFILYNGTGYDGDGNYVGGYWVPDAPVAPPPPPESVQSGYDANGNYVAPPPPPAPSGPGGYSPSDPIFSGMNGSPGSPGSGMAVNPRTGKLEQVYTVYGPGENGLAYGPEMRRYFQSDADRPASAVSLAGYAPGFYDHSGGFDPSQILGDLGTAALGTAGFGAGGVSGASAATGNGVTPQTIAADAAGLAAGAGLAQALPALGLSTPAVEAAPIAAPAAAPAVEAPVAAAQPIQMASIAPSTVTDVSAPTIGPIASSAPTGALDALGLSNVGTPVTGLTDWSLPAAVSAGALPVAAAAPSVTIANAAPAIAAPEASAAAPAATQTFPVANTAPAWAAPAATTGATTAAQTGLELTPLEQLGAATGTGAAINLANSGGADSAVNLGANLPGTVPSTLAPTPQDVFPVTPPVVPPVQMMPPAIFPPADTPPPTPQMPPAILPEPTSTGVDTGNTTAPAPAPLPDPNGPVIGGGTGDATPPPYPVVNPPTTNGTLGGTKISDILSGNADVGQLAKNAITGLTVGDLTKLLGGIVPSITGAIASNQQANALKDLNQQYMGITQPSRDRYEASFAPNFDVNSIPGLTGAIDTSTQALLRGLSTQGNPYGNPGGLAEAQKYIVGNVALPALNTYRNQNAATGGYNAFSTAAPSAATGAINATGNVANSIGYGLGTTLNPPTTIEQLLSQLKGTGIKATMGLT